MAAKVAYESSQGVFRKSVVPVVAAPAQKPPCRQDQQPGLVRDQAPEIDPIGRKGGELVDLGACKSPSDTRSSRSINSGLPAKVEGD